MNEIVSDFLVPAIVGAFSGGGVFMLLSKKWVSNWFEKDLKKYQNKLDIIKTKDEIKFNVLHKEMVTRMSRIFCLIADIIKPILNLFIELEGTRDENNIKAHANVIMEKVTAYKTYIIESSLFLPQKLDDSLKQLGNLYASVIGLCESADIKKEDVGKIRSGFLIKYNEIISVIRNQVKTLFGVDTYIGAEE